MIERHIYGQRKLEGLEIPLLIQCWTETAITAKCHIQLITHIKRETSLSSTLWPWYFELAMLTH